MRNLKKVLSLALAMVMLLGMMVVGAGATNFKDADKISDEYKIAAAILEKIGVMEGNSDGYFNPAKELNRVEGAAIIYRIVMGGIVKNPVGVSGFADVDDVPNYSWAAGTVAACRDLGIIDGVSDTSFNPGGELTAAAYAKMLLVALGYESDKQGYTGDGWIASVTRDARTRGILLEGMSMSANLTREQAAQMALQTLTADTMEYAGLNFSGEGFTATSPATVRTYNSVNGNEAGETYNGLKITNPATTPIKLCEEKFPDLRLAPTNDESYGRAQTMWTWKRVLIDNTVTNVTPDAVFTKGEGASDIRKEIGKASTKGAKVYKNGSEVVIPTTDSDENHVFDADAIAQLTGKGRVVEVYLEANNYSQVEKIVVVDVAMGEVTKVNTKDEKITIKLDKSAVTNYKNVSLTTAEGYGEFDKGDKVLVTGYNKDRKGNGYFDKDNTNVVTVVEPVVITDLATRKDHKNSTITMDGTAYAMAYAIADESNGKDDSSFDTFVLDKTKNSTLYLVEVGGVEYVVKAEGAKEDPKPADNLIAVKSAYSTLDNNKIVNKVDGVLSNGQEVTWKYDTVKSDSKISTGIYSYTGSEPYTLKAVTTQVNPQTTGNNKNYVAEKGSDTDARTHTYGSTSVYAKYLNKDELDNNNVYMFAKDVKFIFVDVKNSDVEVLDGQQEVTFTNTDGKAIAYALSEKDREVTAVFLTDTPNTFNIDDIIFVHQKNPNDDQWVETDDGNAIYYGYDAYDVNGEQIDGFRATEKVDEQTFIQSQINEYEGYPVNKKPSKGTVLGKVVKTNNVNGSNTFKLEDNEGNEKSFFTNSDTTVVNLTKADLDSVAEINAAVKAGETVNLAVIYTGNDNDALVARTIFVYEPAK